MRFMKPYHGIANMAAICLLARCHHYSIECTPLVWHSYTCHTLPMYCYTCHTLPMYCFAFIQTAHDASPEQDVASWTFLLHALWQELWQWRIPRERWKGILSGVLLWEVRPSLSSLWESYHGRLYYRPQCPVAPGVLLLQGESAPRMLGCGLIMNFMHMLECDLVRELTWNTSNNEFMYSW